MHKKVVLWRRKDLLGDVMESFLNTQNDWDIINVTEDEPAKFFIEQVEKNKPDVVVIYEGAYVSITPLPALLMQACPTLRVITVNFENNSLEVFDKQKIQIEKASDLFSAMSR